MKNIKYFITIIILSLGIFLGLSKVELLQKQNQNTTVNQVAQSGSYSMVIMDNHKNFTNIYWIVTNVKKNQLEGFINSLDLFQQYSLKYDGKIVIYPEINTRQWNSKTNFITNYSTNINKINFSPFRFLKNKK